MEKIKRLEVIAEIFKANECTLYYVGGCCRDWIQGNKPEDIDICIVGAKNHLKVIEILEGIKDQKLIDSLTLVFGKFPIWIVEFLGCKMEFAMARKEAKTGNHRTEFTVNVNDVTIEEDLIRRDFTINAIAKNVITGEYIDPYNGRDHIKERILHPVSEAFKEDPLRVIRGARFAARFLLKPSEMFFKYASELTNEGLSHERVGIELMKTMKTAVKPSIFFNLLRDCGWLGYYFKEVEDLIGVPQNPIHHPEGDAYIHTMHCVDSANDWFIRTVMLCHDLGKAITTTIDGVQFTGFDTTEVDWREDMKIQSKGHEAAGVPLTRDMLNRISFVDKRTISKICLLVELHMIRIQLSEKVVRRSLRRLHEAGLSWSILAQVCAHDVWGRPPLVCKAPDMMESYVDYLMENDLMTPVVTGKLLIEKGFTENVKMGEIIEKALELQDRGTLNKDNWMKVLIGTGFKSLKSLKL